MFIRYVKIRLSEDQGSLIFKNMASTDKMATSSKIGKYCTVFEIGPTS